jgi:hypothetical protein
MPITWRPATCRDIEPCLSIQLRHRGDALIGLRPAVESWHHLVCDPFFASAVLESSPAIKGYVLIGFGAAAFVSRAFADAEIANPRPNINSRVIGGIHSRQPVLATRDEIARANAGEGVDVMVLFGSWRDQILDVEQRHEVYTLLASSFTESLGGYRVRRILYETADEPARDFVQRSVVYKAIAEFSELGRVIYLMTRESVRAVPASLGNVIFSFREPLLRLRESDQQLLLAALDGTTDPELARKLGVSLPAVKARWRSSFERIEAVMPRLVSDVDDHDGRGSQKRHRVLAYVRTHPEELRPYYWNGKLQRKTA